MNVPRRVALDLLRFDLAYEIVIHILHDYLIGTGKTMDSGSTESNEGPLMEKYRM